MFSSGIPPEDVAQNQNKKQLIMEKIFVSSIQTLRFLSHKNKKG